jgi:hypothetical protein
METDPCNSVLWHEMKASGQLHSLANLSSDFFVATDYIGKRRK